MVATYVLRRFLQSASPSQRELGPHVRPRPGGGIQTPTSAPGRSSPGLFISIAVLVYDVMGDGLRDAFDPKLRT